MKVNKKELLFLFLGNLAIISIFLYRNFPIPSDETIYFNMAKSFSEGLIPYKDFFYAHPPLHILFLSSIFFFFGRTFEIAKLYVTFLALLVNNVLFLLSKNLLKKDSIISILFLILNPIYLSFGNISTGFWQASLFFLLSLYLSFKKRDFLAGFLFSLSFLTRYLLILFLPFMLYLSRKKWLFLTTFLLFSFLLVYPFLGRNFIEDTIIYHFQRVSTKTYFDVEYWSFGIFDLMIFLIAIVLIKEKTLRSIFIAGLLYEVLIFVLIKQLIYYYFIPSILLTILALNCIWKRGDQEKILVLFIIIFNFLFNLSTIQYYWNINNFIEMYELNEYFKNLPQNATILGDPVITNFISFKNGMKVKNNVFDCDLKRIMFNKTEIVKAFEQKPTFIVERNERISFLERFYWFNELLKSYDIVFKGKKYVVYKLTS